MSQDAAHWHGKFNVETVAPDALEFTLIISCPHCQQQTQAQIMRLKAEQARSLIRELHAGLVALERERATREGGA
jgi:hypothetical protein